MQVWTAESALRFQSPFPGSEWKKPSKGCSKINNRHVITENEYRWHLNEMVHAVEQINGRGEKVNRKNFPVHIHTFNKK